MKYILMLFAFCLVNTASQAQSAASKSKTHHENMGHHMKDCVMMKDGKMMMMKNGKMMEMDKDMTMSNGMVCMKDGTCRMKNGKTMKMKEGETCDMHGKMGKMKMDGKMKM